MVENPIWHTLIGKNWWHLRKQYLISLNSKSCFFASFPFTSFVASWQDFQNKAGCTQMHKSLKLLSNGQQGVATLAGPRSNCIELYGEITPDTWLTSYLSELFLWVAQSIYSFKSFLIQYDVHFVSYNTFYSRPHSGVCIRMWLPLCHSPILLLHCPNVGSNVFRSIF